MVLHKLVLHLYTIRSYSFDRTSSRLYKNHIPKMTNAENTPEKLQHTLGGKNLSRIFCVFMFPFFFY